MQEKEGLSYVMVYMAVIARSQKLLAINWFCKHQETLRINWYWRKDDNYSL
jgi:hypothetical protein